MSQRLSRDDERQTILSPWNYALPTPGELAVLRDRAGLTKTDAAERMGVHRETILRYESGEASPSLEATRELLGIYRAEIIAGKESNQ